MAHQESSCCKEGVECCLRWPLRYICSHPASKAAADRSTSVRRACRQCSGIADMLPQAAQQAQHASRRQTETLNSLRLPE